MGGHSSFGGGHSSGGYSSGGHGGYSSGGHSSGGSGYTAVHGGYQTSEGLHVDPHLLHKIKAILIEQENLHGGGGHGSSHGGFSHGISSQYGAPSSHYGAPSSSYGPPSHHSSHVVGIDFGHVQQGHQVAQYHQIAHEAGHYPSSSYGAPSVSSSYGAPSVSSFYHAPSVSSSYGVPH